MAGIIRRQKFQATNNLVAGGDGKSGCASYTSWDQSGYMTSASIGRVLKELTFDRTDFQIPSAASGHAVSGSLYMLVGGASFNVPTISPSSTSCDMVFDMLTTAPLDADTSASMTPFIEMLVNTNVTTASGLGWTLNYNYINAAACSTTAGSVQGTISTTASLGVGGRVSGSLPQIPAFGGAGQVLVIMLRGLTGACGAGVNFDFSALRLQYTSNHLGTQSSV